MRTPTRFGWRAFGPFLLVAAAAVAAATPASAQIVSPSKEGARGSGELPLVIGVGFEFTNDPEAQELNYPFTLEYNFTEEFKLVTEWSVTRIRSKDPSIQSASGMGDLETFIEWEFLPERRYRPALTVETGVKWPTAPAPDLGSGKADFALGLVASKDISTDWKLDLGLVYTYVGHPSGLRVDGILETSLAAEWKVSHVIDLEAELLYSHGGAVHGAGSAVNFGAGRLFGGGGSEFELSIGVAWHLNDYLKVETGAVVQPDGSWQVVVFWELDFTGDR